MTHYEQALHSLPENIGSFFQLQGDELAFVDPLYGGRLGSWPPTLEHDGISKTGRQYLQNSSHQLTVIHSMHRGPKNFSDIVQAHGGVLEAATILAVEAGVDSAAVNPTNPASIVIPSGGRGEFVRAEMEWAERQEKIIMPYDIDGPVTPLRSSLIKLFDGDIPDGVIPFAPEVSAERRSAVTREIGWAAYTRWRLPMMLGHLGFGLATLRHTGRLAPDAKIVATLGVGNYPSFVNIVRASGVMAAENITCLTVGPTDGPELASDVLPLGPFRRRIAASGISLAELT